VGPCLPRIDPKHNHIAEIFQWKYQQHFYCTLRLADRVASICVSSNAVILRSRLHSFTCPIPVSRSLTSTGNHRYHPIRNQHHVISTSNTQKAMAASKSGVDGDVEVHAECESKAWTEYASKPPNVSLPFYPSHSSYAGSCLLCCIFV
jgi:hypothetical protein